MAARIESVHLRDLLDDSAACPSNLRRLAAHLGDLVRFASQAEAERAAAVPVPCRFRPGRRPCGGLLVVYRHAAEDRVQWHCPDCRAAGVITGWQGTVADLRAMGQGAKRDVRELAVSVETLAALRDIARDDPEFGRLAFTARLAAAGAVLRIGDGDRLRCGARLAMKALQASSRRAAGLLATLADALTEPGDPRAGSGELMELHESVVPDLLQALLDLPDSRPPEYAKGNARGRLMRIKSRRRGPPQTFQIKVTLRDVRPPVWRRLLVPADILLPRLHEVLQVAMGWQDCHLHLFRVGNRCYAPPGDWAPVGEDSRGLALVDLAPEQGARLVYEYDFGDGWAHDILVESVMPQRCEEVRCTAGRRNCPPEDCGGPWGYAELLEAMAGAPGERAEDLREWCAVDFDPAEFDVRVVDAALRSLG